MKTIGIVGGIASGKSAITAEFERLGAGRLDADRAGHAVLDEPAVRERIVARWGEDVLGSDGRIDRSAVAKIVFAPPPRGPVEQRFLENLTHPWIRRRLEEEAAKMVDRGIRVAVLDAPLLIEVGWDALCDEVLFIDAPTAIRRRRAAVRGWNTRVFHDREAAQADLKTKRTRADVVIDNSGTLEETRAQVRLLWERWAGKE